jgi:hypothetical protein
LRVAVGGEEFSGLITLLDALDTGEEERMRTYLQRSTHRSEGGVS